jgi:protein-S-isoprenylcysteine O-methyltransferase Ste14
MLFLLVGTALMISTLLSLTCAVAVLMLGTQIRVNAEEKLLESRFGGEFREYRRSVPAYIPFLRFTSKADPPIDR